ncbi:MAG: L-rhamnonate dehydratase [Sphingopyxis sp.]|nr:L-rhamnonate dehydratase [Sphingopyxis sp.]
MRISKVEVIRIGEPEWSTPAWWATCNLDALFETGIKFRKDPIGLFNKPIGTAGDPVFAIIVRIFTNDGLDGFGVVALGSEAVAQVVENRLAPLILGKDPFDVELIWELMYRSTLNIGRKGLVLQAISGVDIALWDLMGKAVDKPMFALMGGRTRDRIRGYASAGYAMDDLDEVAQMAREYRDQGFTAMKMRFGWGPLDGRAGMRRNVEMVAKLRDAIGDDMDLAADAYMGWTTQYAIEMLEKLKPYDLAWIEEPISADDYEGHARLRASTSIAIAGGEHEATRYGYRDLITRGCVDIVQLDVNRCGGPTEARKIVALAQAFNLPVIPHAPETPNIHLVMAHHNMPMVEVFPNHGRDGDTFTSELVTGDPICENGHVMMTDSAGLGVKLNWDVIDNYRVM